MSDLNLHKIFCHLTNDEHFLSTVIETTTDDIERKKNSKKGINVMANMISGYVILSPYQTQKYDLFPPKMKKFLTPNFMRMGVKNTIDRNATAVNISFLNSLNMLIRPELYKMDINDHLKNLELLENYICHNIKRNSQIDKTKNTKKVQAVNKELIKKLTEGKITQELIQYIVNIFEINLLIFDLTKMDVTLYWAHGYKYPYLNLFKNIYCMSCVCDNYEPIMPQLSACQLTEAEKRNIYVNILTHASEVKCDPAIKMSLYMLLYISSWDIDLPSYFKIIELYFNEPYFNVTQAINALEKLEKLSKK